MLQSNHIAFLIEQFEFGLTSELRVYIKSKFTISLPMLNGQTCDAITVYIKVSFKLLNCNYINSN